MRGGRANGGIDKARRAVPRGGISKRELFAGGAGFAAAGVPATYAFAQAYGWQRDKSYRSATPDERGAYTADEEHRGAPDSSRRGYAIPPEPLTVRIPSDFPDLQTAIDTLVTVPADVATRIILLIERGHRLEGGLYVRDGDYARFTIAAEDEVVRLARSWRGVSDAELVDMKVADNLFMGINARMPTLACLIDMEEAGGSGYYGVWNCDGLVLEGSGVVNAGHNGLSWRAGVCSAFGTVFSGAGNAGIRASHCALVAAQQATCDECGRRASHVGTGAVDVSRSSTVHFRLGSARNSGESGANIRRNSTLCAEEADFSGARYVGLLVQHGSNADVWGAKILGTRATATDEGYGLWVIDSTVNAQGATIRDNRSGSGWDVRVGDSSPDRSMGLVDLTRVESTKGVNRIENTNLANFNEVSRYGIAFNSEVEPPIQSGHFSPTGAGNGFMTDPDENYLNVSRDTVEPAWVARFWNPNGGVGGISVSGESTSFLTTSDRRLKVVTGNAEGALAAVVGVPVRWARFASERPGSERAMLLADELQARLPRAVQGAPDGPDPQMVDYAALAPTLWAAVRELAARVAALEADRVGALENEQAGNIGGGEQVREPKTP